MPTRPRLFLLDANVVIELHRIGLWQRLTGCCQIIVPSIVAEREAQFWDSGEGVGKPIPLGDDLAAGRIAIREADAAAMKDTLDLFDPVMQQSLDAGELEALTILREWSQDPPSFSTADFKACEALCLLGLSHLAVSLEEVLERSGLTHRVRPHFSRSALQQVLRRARAAGVQRSGLAGVEGKPRRRR